jgi:hypothetical protein
VELYGRNTASGIRRGEESTRGGTGVRVARETARKMLRYLAPTATGGGCFDLVCHLVGSLQSGVVLVQQSPHPGVGGSSCIR